QWAHTFKRIFPEQAFFLGDDGLVFRGREKYFRAGEVDSLWLCHGGLTPSQRFSWLRVRTPDCWEKLSCPSTLIPSNTMSGSMAGLMVPGTLLNAISPRRSS